MAVRGARKPGATEGTSGLSFAVAGCGKRPSALPRAPAETSRMDGLLPQPGGFKGAILVAVDLDTHGAASPESVPRAAAGPAAQEDRLGQSS
jgi:hypothetical protein